MKAIPCILGAAFAASLCPTTVKAQKCIAPSIGSNGTASTSTSYPWNRRNASIRVQYSYDPTEVPTGGRVMVIQQIKFRPFDGTATSASWIGGTYGDVEIKMSHGAQSYDKLTTNFANNHGQNKATVFKGAVKVLPGKGTGANVPSNPYVDIRLQKLFVYNPKNGPLLIDIASDGSKWVVNSGSGTPTVLSATTFTQDPKKVTRMYNLGNHTATTGTLQNQVGLVMEIVCATSPVVTIGASCSDGFGNFGRHFTNQKPTVGNGSFNLEGDTLPPSATALLIIGVNKNFQSIDLTPAGAPTCFLHADSVVELFLTTTKGTASKSDGTLNVPAAIPNNSALKGFYIRSQIAVADANSKRALKIVFTNGLGITVQ